MAKKAKAQGNPYGNGLGKQPDEIVRHMLEPLLNAVAEEVHRSILAKDYRPKQLKWTATGWKWFLRKEAKNGHQTKTP